MPDTHVLAEPSSQGQLAVYDAIVIGAGISGLYMPKVPNGIGLVLGPNKDGNKYLAGVDLDSCLDEQRNITVDALPPARTGHDRAGLRGRRECRRHLVLEPLSRRGMLPHGLLV